MTTPIPACSTREVLNALQRAGWQRCKSRGHYVLRGNGRTVAIPRGDLHYNTLLLIIRQAGLTKAEFCELLRKG